MNERQIQTFCKRLNTVLEGCDWPPVMYVGGPDLYREGKPHSIATIRSDLFPRNAWQAHRLRMTVERQDTHQRIEITAEPDLLLPRFPSLKVRNDLIRFTKAALAASEDRV